MTVQEAEKVVQRLIVRLVKLGEDTDCDYGEVTNDIGCDAKEALDALRILLPNLAKEKA